MAICDHCGLNRAVTMQHAVKVGKKTWKTWRECVGCFLKLEGKQ